MMKRPDMRRYFAAQIDIHVRGLLAGSTPQLPAGVARVRGSVRDSEIVVTMADGTVWKWAGGRYSSRKVSGCYAHLQPVKVD